MSLIKKNITSSCQGAYDRSTSRVLNKTSICIMVARLLTQSQFTTAFIMNPKNPQQINTDTYQFQLRPQNCLNYHNQRDVYATIEWIQLKSSLVDQPQNSYKDNLLSKGDQQQDVMDQYLESIDRRYKRLHCGPQRKKKSPSKVLVNKNRQWKGNDALCVFDLAGLASARLLQRHKLPIPSKQHSPTINIQRKEDLTTRSAVQHVILVIRNLWKIVQTWSTGLKKLESMHPQFLVAIAFINTMGGNHLMQTFAAALLLRTPLTRLFKS